MLKFRLKALRIYEAKPMPQWGGDLSDLEATLDEIYFYVKPQDQMERSWDDVPENIKTTFSRNFSIHSGSSFCFVPHSP